jgi:Glycosyl hydrolase family 45
LKTLALKQITRFSVLVSAGLFCASGLASCVGDSLDNPGGVAGSLGNGVSGAQTTGGAGVTAGSGNVSAGATSLGGSSSSVSGGANASGGTGSGTAGNGNGNGGASSTGGTTSQPPCTDVPPVAEQGQPPNDCVNAMEYNWCDADWNNGQFCRKTCGDCSDGSGGGANGGGGAGGAPVVTGPKLPDITGGQEYHASRYWDCCKTHCATNAGAPSCGKDGVSQNGGTSSCQNGPAYACYSEAPRALGSHLSYGHVAKRSANCGACYQIQFTGQGFYSANDPGSKLIAGKQMIVKVSNAGNDVADAQFDLMIPGGGVGQNTQGCKNQWGQIDFGVTYGGFYSGDPQNAKCNDGTHAQKKACVKALCGQLPAGDARDGCNWWVDWLELADNPKFRFKETQCPNDI